jgi:hypothetical protein
MGEHLAAMRELFEQKEPEKRLDGFQYFDAWKESKAATYGVSKRTLEYYLLDTETVVPIIGREAAIALPLGTMAELGKLAKVKGTITDETLQFAQEHSAREVKAHVAAILYPGKTGHFDGPEDFITITSKKAQVSHLRRQLDVARQFVEPIVDAKGKVYPVGDADLIEFALEEFIQTHAAAKEAERPESFPAPPDFSDLIPEEFTEESDEPDHATA